MSDFPFRLSILRERILKRIKSIVKVNLNWRMEEIRKLCELIFSITTDKLKISKNLNLHTKVIPTRQFRLKSIVA